VIFHINALTGEDALGKSPVDKVLQGVDLISGPSLGAYPLPGNSNSIILLDEFLQVRLTDLMPLFSFANTFYRYMFTPRRP
jgi:ER membrane protein complex subunit 1